MDKKIIIIISAVAVVLLIALILGGYFYWINYKKIKTNDFGSAEDITNSATKGVLPSLGTNPLENKPDINPAEAANPIKDIKINPFE